MKIILNDYIPFKGYKLMTVYPFLFVRRGTAYTAFDINHEEIHARQQKELLLVGFYVWYVLEWLVRLCVYRNAHKAYRNISFEREAYANECYNWYISERRMFNFLNYI